MNWLRWYIGTCTDAKLHKASRLAGCRRSVVIAAWAAVLEEARRNGDEGEIQAIDSSWLAGQIDERKSRCESALRAMREVGLLDDSCVVSFKKRQFANDSSTQRVRKHRAKLLAQQETDPPGNVPVTRYGNDQNRTEQNRKNQAPDGAAQQYAFTGRIIRLKQDDFDAWQQAYRNLDLRSELQCRDDWLASDRATDADRKSWYIPTSNWLRNQNTKTGPKGPARRQITDAIDDLMRAGTDE